MGCTGAKTPAKGGSTAPPLGTTDSSVRILAGTTSTAPTTTGLVRSRTSVRMDEMESKKATEVSMKFTASIKSNAKNNEPRFTLANRDDWPKYQALLHNVAEFHATVKDVNCELVTSTDQALTAYDKVVTALLGAINARVQRPKEEAFLEDTFVSPILKGCVFIGHVATDLDSVAGAIGAAALFGGIACKSEVLLNGEIRYALKEVAKLPEPPLFDETPGCSKPDEDGSFKKVCLVDHNEGKQMVPSLRDDPNRKKRIVGLIDHHALADSFSSEGPLFMDVRPWGSMSTIVAHMYIRNNVKMDSGVARIMMCAILSDTLNLLSVTTTDADRFAVALLAKVGGVEDPDEVARMMFRAKTDWIVNLGSYAMVRGDQKDFSADGWKFGVAVLEVTDTAPVLAVAADLIIELRMLKKEKGNGVTANELDFAYVFVVDVVKQCSLMLVCGGREYALAEKAFPGCPFGRAHPDVEAPGDTITAEQTLCDVGPMVSRKAQFVPAFLKVLNAGFTCHKERVTSENYQQDADDKALDEAMKGGQATVTLDEAQNFRRSCTAQVRSSIFTGSQKKVPQNSV